MHSSYGRNIVSLELVAKILDKYSLMCYSCYCILYRFHGDWFMLSLFYGLVVKEYSYIMYRTYFNLMLIIWLIEIWFLGECIFVDIWRPCNRDWRFTLVASLGSRIGSQEARKWDDDPICNGDGKESSSGKHCGSQKR